MNKIYEDLSKQNPLNMSKALLSYEIYNNETAEEMFKKLMKNLKAKREKLIEFLTPLSMDSQIV